MKTGQPLLFVNLSAVFFHQFFRGETIRVQLVFAPILFSVNEEAVVHFPPDGCRIPEGMECVQKFRELLFGELDRKSVV